MAEYYDGKKDYGAARYYYAAGDQEISRHGAGQASRASEWREIKGEPEKPPKRLALFVDLFPESRERSRVARIPELQNGGTRLAEVPDNSGTTVGNAAPANDRSSNLFQQMLTQRRRGIAKLNQRLVASAENSQFRFAICALRLCVSYCLFALIALAGCVGYQVGTGSLYAPDVATVYVPMIDSDSYRRDLGERLTEAVVKEIELKTPYKVVSTPDADSILSARLLTDTRRTLVENAFDDPRVSETELRAEVTWLNRRRLPIVPGANAADSARAGRRSVRRRTSSPRSANPSPRRSSRPSSGWPSRSFPRWKRRGEAGCQDAGCRGQDAWPNLHLREANLNRCNRDSADTSRAPRWQLRTRTLEFPRRPLVMGIVNVTPDSFSDGGRFLDADAAVAHALQLVADGADLLDIGGESTRPYSEPVAADEELRRVLPVVERLVGAGADSDFDRYQQGGGRPGGDRAGAEIINDVTGLDRRSGDGSRWPSKRAPACARCTCKARRKRCRTIRRTPMSSPKCANICASGAMRSWRPASRASESASIRASASAKRTSTTSRSWRTATSFTRSAVRCWSVIRARVSWAS